MDPSPNSLGPNTALGPIIAIRKSIRVDVDLGLTAAATDVTVRGHGLLLARDGFGDIVGEPAGRVPDFAQVRSPRFRAGILQSSPSGDGVFHLVGCLVIDFAAADYKSAPRAGRYGGREKEEGEGEEWDEEREPGHGIFNTRRK